MNINQYDIKSMKNDCKKAIFELENNILKEFQRYFLHFYENSSVPEIVNHRNNKTCLYEINDIASINEVYNGAGLYLIVTDYQFADNKCLLTFDESFKVIYRGESVKSQYRTESHLLNKSYNIRYKEREHAKLKAGKNFGEVRYNVCMKIRKNESGININKEPYSKFRWFVIIHKM